jgi:hypothetical protein
MFNEAFWFFYWVNVVEYLTIFLTTLGIASAFGAFVAFGIWIFEEKKEARPYFISVTIFCVLCFFLAMFTPSTKALYAGAGQYIGETTEVDETLIRLKNLIDEKIDEQLKEPKQ